MDGTRANSGQRLFSSTLACPSATSGESVRLERVPKNSQSSSRRRSGRGGGTFLLETFPAKHRTALCGLERNGRFLAASRTICAGLDLGVVARRCGAHVGGSLGLAGLTALGLVLELL